MRRIAIARRVPFKGLIYGKPGSRKTTFAATAALDERSSPVLWIDAGGNPISVARVAGAAKNIDVLEIDAITDLQDIYQYVAAGSKADDKFARLNQLRGGYKTLVFDGITHMQRLSGDSITGTINMAPGATPPKMEWPQYGQILRQMILIASRFYTLPMHVIVTALEHTETRYVIPGDTSASNTFTYREPAIFGASVEEFPGWALNVGRSAIADSYDPRVIQAVKGFDAYAIVQFKPTRYVDAKDQHGLGDYMADPTMAKVLDIIERKPAQATASA